MWKAAPREEMMPGPVGCLVGSTFHQQTSFRNRKKRKLKISKPAGPFTTAMSVGDCFKSSDPTNGGHLICFTATRRCFFNGNAPLPGKTFMYVNETELISIQKVELLPAPARSRISLTPRINN
ncbi:hypothetical protein J6590_008282 [Homalodisca vitripennis]|nr:hypothetical protein J6590_008282 [Homalodisca vitripennis]